MKHSPRLKNRNEPGMNDILLIDDVEAIDAAWLQAIFARNGINAADLEIRDVTPIGQGNLADVVRVSLTSTVAAVPSSLVLKLSARSATTSAFAQAFGAYLREVFCYRQLLQPSLYRVPHCIFAEVSDDGLKFNLVMEDLSEARSGNQVTGCNVNEAESALLQLANLHRTHWNDSRMLDVTWLINPRGEYAAMQHQMYAQGVEQFRQRYAAEIDPDFLSLMEKIAPRVGEWAAAPSARNALCHNDARVDNFMFIDHADGAIEAVILDWQLASYRNPLADVAYFMTGSISVEDRRTHEKDLLRAYFERVREADVTLTFEQVLDDYRSQIISGLVATVGSSVVIPPGDRDALLLALATRNSAAVLDWDFI